MSQLCLEEEAPVMSWAGLSPVEPRAEGPDQVALEAKPTKDGVYLTNKYEFCCMKIKSISLQPSSKCSLQQCQCTVSTLSPACCGPPNGCGVD